MADPAKITLDDLIGQSARADNLAHEQVRDALKQIAERECVRKAPESQIVWRLLTKRNDDIQGGSPGFLDAKQLAEHLSVPKSWVREQARLGQLPSVKLGHYVRFRLDDIKEHLSTRTACLYNDAVPTTGHERYAHPGARLGRPALEL